MAPKRTRRPKGNVRVAARPKRRRVTIDILPEDVLLEIFDHNVDPTRKEDRLETWCTLVHVCRKWRNVVLESPLRLNLRISCHPATPVREKLDIWPALPIALQQRDDFWRPEWDVVDNVAAALEQNHRICQIGLWGVPTSQMEGILVGMHKSFPVLAYLNLEPEDETPVLVDPDLFLGGSAPCLRFLQLASIPFPGLPKLLSSATHLTDLRLLNLSHSGYISPEAMVSCISALTRLETLFLEFESPESFPVPEHRRPPPPTCTLLPALTWLQFNGVCEYLEDLVVRINTPLLESLKITLFHQSIHDTARLVQLINRTPKLKALDVAHVTFGDFDVDLTLCRAYGKQLVEISYQVVDRRVSSVAQICTSLSQAFSANVERLYIHDVCLLWRCDIRENNHWLELFRPFTSVKSLYLAQVIVPRIAPALQELIGESVAGVLPALQTLFLEDPNLSRPVQEAIGSFVSGRQFSSHPVAVSHWEGRLSD